MREREGDEQDIYHFLAQVKLAAVKLDEALR